MSRYRGEIEEYDENEHAEEATPAPPAKPPILQRRIETRLFVEFAHGSALTRDTSECRQP